MQSAAAGSLELEERYLRLAHDAHLPYLLLDPAPGGRDPVDHAAASLVPLSVAREYGFVCVEADDDRVVVAVPDPRRVDARDVARALTGRMVDVAIASPEGIRLAQERAYGLDAYATRLPSRVRRRRTGAVIPAGAVDPPTAPRLLGDLLVQTGLITQLQLVEALRIQERVGGRIGEVLVHAGVVDEEQVAAGVASQRRLPVADMSRLAADPNALAILPEPLARRLRVVPLAIEDHVLYLAASEMLDADSLATVREFTRLPIRTIIGTRRGVDDLMQRTYATRYTRLATAELLNRAPAESAYQTLTAAQRFGFCALGLALLLCFLYSPIQTIVAVNVAAMVFYLGFAAYKLKLIYDALGHSFELPVSDEELAALNDRDLPVYTILVPLYREANVLPKLIRSLVELDYPPTKLDVKLLIEEDDEETRDALAALELPPHFNLVVVPDSQPKTKPKACNYGLIQAVGEYVVIYDAEDEPEPDQLKKIIVGFAKAEPAVACIQCKLNYYNRNQNILTRWFTIEYSSWFDLFMPGLDAAGSPIPLGGTSNHFKRSRLVELGAWDPFNVTEDADLGIRLHKAGFTTAIVDSTTYEEANSDLYNWIRQRSRWVKGYIQTWLVHMRHPVALYRQVGLRSWLSFQFVVGGTFFSFLVNPLYWALTTVWLATNAGWIRDLFPSFVYYLAAVGLYLGNFVFTFANLAGALRRGYYDLVKYALLSPLYWGLMSIGAYKGLAQLFYRPFYWEKTVHGLDIAAKRETTP